MNIRQIQNFVAVGEEENFHRAAERMGVTQPALTRQIQTLEDELQAELFERLPRGVRLSEAGRAFLTDAREILGMVEMAAKRARSVASGQSGTLRIAVSESGSMTPVISRSIRAFRSNRPDVEVEYLDIDSMNQLEALRTGRIDVGLLYGIPEDDTTFETREVTRQELMLALPRAHPLLRRHSLTLADIEDEPLVWITRATNHKLYDASMRPWREQGRAPRIVQQVTTGAGLYSLVSAGLGLGLVLSAMPFKQPDDVILRTVSDMTVPFPLDLAWRRNNDSPVLRQFIHQTLALMDETN